MSSKSTSEALFVTELVSGATIASLGVAFLILGATVNTSEPAPYVSPTDKAVILAVSTLAVVGGLYLIRLAAREVGW